MVPTGVGFIGLSTKSSLGAGYWGAAAYLPAIRALKNNEIVGVANSTAESAPKSIDFHGMSGAKAYGNPAVSRKIPELSSLSFRSAKTGRILSTSIRIDPSALATNGWFPGVEHYLDIKFDGNEFHILFGQFLDSFVHVLGGFADLSALLKSYTTNVPVVDSNGQAAQTNHKTAPDHIPTSAPERAIGTKLGRGEVQNIDYPTKDDVPEATVPSLGANMARLYDNFAKGDKEIYATFESALETHRLLDRSLRSAGWDSV
ncbi:hypothetical protein DL769_004693 [Monosporascus sp. CRB-8-3]|nr:hypothetical protein DL769_004693 [Monosporascus sp. CRB-8-3]